MTNVDCGVFSSYDLARIHAGFIADMAGRGVSEAEVFAAVDAVGERGVFDELVALRECSAFVVAQYVRVIDEVLITRGWL